MRKLRLRLHPSRRKGRDTAAPSGKFCKPMPTATLTAPIRASGLYPFCKAPKATPTARPSGILCRVMESTSRITRFFPPVSTCPSARLTSLSEPQRNRAPIRNPTVATSQAGSPGSLSAWAMAGSSNDQKLAAIMTPAEKPSIRFSVFSLGEEKNTTVAAPKAVTSQVPKVAAKAIQIHASITHLLPSV